MKGTMTVQECLVEARFWYGCYENDRSKVSYLETAIDWMNTAKKLAKLEADNNEDK